MKFTTIEIRKRSKVRTLIVPDTSEYYWSLDMSAKFFRFHEDRTEYKRGELTIVFDLAGRAIEGWSYWTCMFCYAAPCEDFPTGRLIYNASGYGSFTGKHVNRMMWFFYGGVKATISERRYSRVEKVVGTWVQHAWTSPYDGTEYPATIRQTTRATQAYTSSVEEREVDAQWHHQADQICWGRGATADDMRHEYASMARHRALTARRLEFREQAALGEEREDAARETGNALWGLTI